MTPDMLATAKMTGLVIGIVCSPAFFFACVKAAVFFGSMEKTVKTLEKLCEGFAEVTKKHGEEIIAVTTRVDGLEREADRRIGDRRKHGD